MFERKNHSGPLNEFSLPVRLASYLQRMKAGMLGWTGGKLRLDFRHLPTSSDLDLAREVLASANSINELRPLSSALGGVLEAVHGALLIPDLKFRHCELERAAAMFEYEPLRTAATRPRPEREALYNSPKRIDNVRAYLESAAFRLHCVFHWTDSLLPQAEEGVAKNLKLAVRRIQEAREFLPSVDLGGW